MSGSLTMEVIQPLEGPSIWHEYLEEPGCHRSTTSTSTCPTSSGRGAHGRQGWVAVQTGDGFGRTRDGRFAYYEHGDDIGCLVELVQAPTERDTPELIYPEPPPAASRLTSTSA